MTDRRVLKAAKALYKHDFPGDKWSDQSDSSKREFIDAATCVAAALGLDIANPHHLAVTEVLIDAVWLSAENRFDPDVVEIVNKIVKAVQDE